MLVLCKILVSRYDIYKLDTLTMNGLLNESFWVVFHILSTSNTNINEFTIQLMEHHSKETITCNTNIFPSHVVLIKILTIQTDCLDYFPENQQVLGLLTSISPEVNKFALETKY